MFVNDLFNPSHKLKVDEYQEEYKQNSPFPHLAIDEFFIEEKLDEVISALEDEEFFLKEADLFQFIQTSDLSESSNPIFREFVSFLLSEEFQSFIEAITSCKLSRKKVDVTGNIYSDTDYLICHDDKLPERKIAFIFYLTDLKEKIGGSLNLFESEHSYPTIVTKKIIPRYNRLMFFEVTPTSFHEVEEVVGEYFRVSLTGWLYESDE